MSSKSDLSNRCGPGAQRVPRELPSVAVPLWGRALRLAARGDGRALTQSAIILLLVLMVAVAAGVTVPLLRALLALAASMLIVGAIWRGWQLYGATRVAGNGRVRLLVMDVDGTLVGADQRVSPRVRRAIARAVELGVHVALCTGRSPAATRTFLDQLELRGPHIFFDGSLVGGATEGDVHLLPADRQALGNLVELCQARGVPVELYSRARHFVARRGPESDWHAQIQGVTAEVADLREVLAREEIVKAELLGRDDETKAAIAEVARTLSGRLRFSRAQVPGFPEYELVNVVHPDVSKGEALRRLAEHLDVPVSATVAVGDGPNDIPLLQMAGLSVAMGDAPAAVKDAASVVTATLEEDGLALAIDQYVLRVGHWE